MAFNVLLFSALAIFAVSCEKDDLLLSDGAENPEAAFNATENNNQAPAPGTQSIAEIAIGAGNW